MKLGVPWTSKGKKGSERSNDDSDAASVHERLDDLTRQLERLSRITAGKVRPPRMAAGTGHDPAPDDDADPPAKFDQRLEEFAAEGRAASTDIARFAGDRTLNRNPLRPVYSDAGLDQTLAEIAARQRALDGETSVFDRRGAEAP